MLLKESIEREMTRLAALPALNSNNERLSVAADVGTLESELTAVDALACTFVSFRLETARLANSSLDELKKLGDALSKRLTYLLEPIRTVEVDPDDHVVQMRSDPPQADENSMTYYELLVRRGELNLRRYTKSPASFRRAVSAHVTREVFQRLAADFVAAVA